MGTIKLSDEMATKQRVTLSGIFISEYLPYAPDSFVKVYIAGLYAAQTDPENTAESVALKLFLSPQTVTEAFAYWQEQGLVRVGENGVEYLPVVAKARQIRKFSKEKYRTFNEQLHALFPNRNILPGEYNAYYTLMEAYNIEIEAMLTVIGYCKRLKGEDISYPYIVTVATNFAKEGFVTFERVSEKIGEFDLYDNELKAIVKALGKKNIEHDDKRLYVKWTKELGFSADLVEGVAKMVKRGGILKLDAKLTKYYELHLTSLSEIENYEKHRESLYDLAKNINRTVGVYYEQLDFIIETYTVNWLGMGFDPPTLLKVAEYCFLHGIRTLEGMHDTLKKLYQKGCVSSESIAAFVQGAAKSDGEIKEVFEAAGISRAVGTRDRDAYRTWSYGWGLPKEVILHGASIARKAESPFSYLNAILASWHEKGVTTVEQAKTAALPSVTPAAPPSARIVTDFSADELNAAFDKLNEDL